MLRKIRPRPRLVKFEEGVAWWTNVLSRVQATSFEKHPASLKLFEDVERSRRSGQELLRIANSFSSFGFPHSFFPMESTVDVVKR